jgi:hypothetical protein
LEVKVFPHQVVRASQLISELRDKRYHCHFVTLSESFDDNGDLKDYGAVLLNFKKLGKTIEVLIQSTGKPLFISK